MVGLALKERLQDIILRTACGGHSWQGQARLGLKSHKQEARPTVNSIEIEKLIANWTNAIEQMEKVLSDEFAEDIRVLKTCRDQLEQAAREIAARSSERDAVGLQHQVELLMELSICPLHKKHKRFCCDCATELETARDAVRREALEEAAQ